MARAQLIIPFFGVMIFLIIGCKVPPKPKQLNTDRLQSQLFSITTDRDTTIVTSSGVVIEIPANAVYNPESKIVEIEVREALELIDILRAGLTTNSGDKLLSSQGMLNISTPLKNTAIKKQIIARVPVNDVVDGMQTFSGEIDKDSTIQWEPKNTSTLPQFDQQDILDGQRLYEVNCKSCHGINEDGTGPALSGVTSRRSMEWIIRYVRNYNDLINECDCEAIEVTKSRPSEMNTFTNLSERDVNEIFTYVDGGTLKTKTNACFDSCRSYSAQIELLERRYLELEKLRKPEVKFNNGSQSSSPIVGTDYLVTKNSPTSLYYQFTIDAWGWYNIDVFMDTRKDLVAAYLAVEVPDFNPEDITVSLVLPSIKSFTDGGLLEGANNKYGFMYKDGKLKLPVDKKSYVFAYGEVDGKFYFAAKEFTTTKSQSILLKPELASTKKLEDYLTYISKNEIKATTEVLATGKLMDALKAEIIELEKLNPKTCNCSCFPKSDSPSSKQTLSEGHHSGTYPCQFSF